MLSNMKLYMVTYLFRLKPALKKLDIDNRKEILKSFKKHYIEISERTNKQSGIMAFHRMWLIVGLALYQALETHMPNKEERIDAIHDIMWKEFVSRQARIAAFFIRRSKDPFKLYLKILGPNNNWFFPCPPWEKVSVDIENGIGWHQKKCPMYDFFNVEGIPELTRAYGDIDELTAGLLPDHIEFKREKALCWGDGHCDFMYYRKS